MVVLRLKEYRESFKMSQREVAEILDMTQQGYCKWENGTSFPNGDRILQLCEIFNCTPNDLFGIHVQYVATMDKLTSK